MTGTKIAYTIEEAAEACGVSHPIIRRAIRNGDLAPRYPTSRAVIPSDELVDWINSLPSEKPGR